MAKAILCFCLILTAGSVFTQGNYIYKITPEDTCLSFNDEILELNNHYYLLSHIYHGISPKRIPTISIYDEHLNKIKQFPLDINNIDYGPANHVLGFTRLFYKENNFYVVGFLTSDTNQHEAIFFARYDEDFHLLQQASIYPMDTIEWYMAEIFMTKKSEFILLFTDGYDSIRLVHLNKEGEILQEKLLQGHINHGKIIETDSHYIANFLNHTILRFSKDSLDNYEWIEIEYHHSESAEGMAIAVNNQIIRDNSFYTRYDECSFVETDRSIVFLNEDLSVKKRLIFGYNCALDEAQTRNIDYLTPDSIYYGYVSNTNVNFWEHGGSSLCIANFSSEGKLHFNHILNIEEESLKFNIGKCIALSNGGVLVAGIAIRFDEVYPFNSRGFLLLWHPTKVFTNINELTVTECKVFPNPAQSQFTVTHTENATVYLYNILGQKVKQIASTEENTVIQTEDLSAGMYVLKIEKENAVVTKKVQVTK